MRASSPSAAARSRGGPARWGVRSARASSRAPWPRASRARSSHGGSLRGIVRSVNVSSWSLHRARAISAVADGGRTTSIRRASPSPSWRTASSGPVSARRSTISGPPAWTTRRIFRASPSSQMGPTQTASHPTKRTSFGGADDAAATLGGGGSRFVSRRATTSPTRMTTPRAVRARSIVESARSLAHPSRSAMHNRPIGRASSMGLFIAPG